MHNTGNGILAPGGLSRLNQDSGSGCPGKILLPPVSAARFGGWPTSHGRSITSLLKWSSLIERGVPQVSPVLRDLGTTRPAEAQSKLVRLSLTPGAAFGSISTESRGGCASTTPTFWCRRSGSVRSDNPSCAAHLQLPGLAKAARPGAPAWTGRPRE